MGLQRLDPDRTIISEIVTITSFVKILHLLTEEHCASDWALLVANRSESHLQFEDHQFRDTKG